MEGVRYACLDDRSRAAAGCGLKRDPWVDGPSTRTTLKHWALATGPPAQTPQNASAQPTPLPSHTASLIPNPADAHPANLARRCCINAALACRLHTPTPRAPYPAPNPTPPPPLMPEDEGPSATNRLAEFLATCVTYPALYIFATSAASPEELAKGQVRAAPGHGTPSFTFSRVTSSNLACVIAVLTHSPFVAALLSRLPHNFPSTYIHRITFMPYRHVVFPDAAHPQPRQQYHSIRIPTSLLPPTLNTTQGPLAAELVPGAPAPPGGGRPAKTLRNKAPAVLPGGGGGGGGGAPAAAGGDLAAALQLQSAASGGLPLPGVLAVGPEARYRLSDFPEGRALVTLERCVGAARGTGSGLGRKSGSLFCACSVWGCACAHCISCLLPPHPSAAAMLPTPLFAPSPSPLPCSPACLVPLPCIHCPQVVSRAGGAGLCVGAVGARQGVRQGVHRGGGGADLVGTPGGPGKDEREDVGGCYIPHVQKRVRCVVRRLWAGAVAPW